MTPSFALYITEEPVYAVPVADMLGISLAQMGDTFESFIIFDKGGGSSYGQVFEIAIPGLVDEGDNSLYITKTGDHINFKLNGSVLFDYDLQYYPSEWFCPSLVALTPSESFIIRSFSVEYKGSRVEM